MVTLICFKANTYLKFSTCLIIMDRGIWHSLNMLLKLTMFAQILTLNFYLVKTYINITIINRIV